MDAVCEGGVWDVITLLENKQIIAVLPYFQKQKNIFHYITMSHLCFQMRAYIVTSYQDRATEILPRLLEQLPKVDFIEQRWPYFISHPDTPNISTDFQLTQRYSYYFEDLSDLTKVYNNIYSSYRNNKMKKAKQLVQIKEDLSIEAFYQINKMTFDRQQMEVPYSLEFLKQLD